MRLPLDLSNGGWHMPKSLNFRHVNRYSEDRTSVGRSRNMGSTCLDTTRLLLHSLMEKRKEPGSKENSPEDTMMSFSMHSLCLRYTAQAHRYSLHLCATLPASSFNAGQGTQRSRLHSS